MTFEEWWESDIALAGEGKSRYEKAEAAWNAGFYQGRLYEGAWKTSRLMEDELFGHLKSAQEGE